MQEAGQSKIEKKEDDAVEETELSEVGNNIPVSSQEEEMGPDQIVVLGEDDPKRWSNSNIEVYERSRLSQLSLPPLRMPSPNFGQLF